MAGSIHRVSAKILNRANNGWDFWYVERDGKLISIDQVRKDYSRDGDYSLELTKQVIFMTVSPTGCFE